MRVFVHNCRGQGAAHHLAGYEAGTQADRTPYGFHNAEELGFTLTLSEDFSDPFLRLIGKISRKLLGFDFGHAFANRKLMRDAQIFWTMTEKEGFAIALLMALGIIKRRPIVTSSVWIFNEWEKIIWFQQYIMIKLSKYLSTITAQSKDVLPVARRVFNREDVKLAYFGINTKTFKITPPRMPSNDGALRIFAGGNDRTRDWPTLVAAFGGRSDFQVDIYCRWMPESLVKNVSNIRIIRNMAIEDFVDAIRSADIAAVPMRTNIFSGITFALNAVALGTPVLCSRTGGVPTYLDENEAIYADAEDADALRAAVSSLPREALFDIATRAQSRFRRDDYTTQAMIKYFAACSRIYAD